VPEVGADLDQAVDLGDQPLRLGPRDGDGVQNPGAVARLDVRGEGQRRRAGLGIDLGHAGRRQAGVALQPRGDQGHGRAGRYEDDGAHSPVHRRAAQES
jgi:hypothetical protein